jgi:alanyl-tRNA synthetase
MRIVADHVRTSTFILGDERGVTPGNVDQGYVLRRLIRRAVRFGMGIDMPQGAIGQVASVIVKEYKDVYPELLAKEAFIIEQLDLEEKRFAATIVQGLKEFEKVITHINGNVLPGKTAFRLYDTFGYPLEMTIELAKERGFEVDVEGYEEAFKKHQEKSRAGSEQRFKGGLADSSEQTARLHTATHLMLAGLKEVLSPDIQQKGSNITAERLRFDFNFPRKVTREELDQVEAYVNGAIAKGIDVVMEEMTVEEAKAAGATGVFESRYGERVKVYTVEGYSKEICGGPHAGNTAELVSFKIKKEESSSAGVRRIKAVIGTN